MISIKKLEKRIEDSRSLLCVGLDSDLERVPQKFRKHKHSQYEFNKYIIEATNKYVCAYKLNTAFYEKRGLIGLEDLKKTIDYINNNHPNIFTICDAKRGDINNTSRAYAEFVYEYLSFDAVTVNPYLGKDSVDPFLEYNGKAVIILVRTSNPGSSDFQDLLIDGRKLWQIIADKAGKSWNVNGNVMMVMGGTNINELKTARKEYKNIHFLVPGIGVQGGDIIKILEAGIRPDASGLVIMNSSRGVIFAKEPEIEAKIIYENILRYLKLR